MRLRSLTLLAGLFLLTLPMLANTTYTYTGNTFGGSPISPYTTDDFVSGSFTVATPIGISSSFNARLNPGNLISFSFADGVQTINDGNSLDGDLFFASNIVVGTDATGKITTWGIGIFNADGGQIDTNNNEFVIGDSVYNSGATQRLASSGTPGTWALASPVPEPSTLAFLATGVLAIAGGARRRFARG